MAQITYDDKVYLNENASVPAINKVQASDMNEIKNVVNANDDKFNYTQEEQRIGTWIDGKPLYRKVIETNVSGTTQMTIPHGISNLAWIIRCDITMLNQYNYFMADSKDINDVSVSSGDIYFTSAWPTGNAKIILEYTKTTD